MRKLERHAKFDPAVNAYNASAFLLAQFGKNYSLPVAERMSGHSLMRQTLLKIEDIQRQIGGGVIFLEAEEHRELLDFYSENAFAPFAERYSDVDDIKYIQMLRLL
ncbi:MAG: hypothetical protein LUH19_01420 [Lachnospiraceae bacterium]|nr:hypothetical protein [Lachnospiraceae bacterium]